MTETPTPARLVPEGKAPTDLTVAELSYVSRKLKADVVSVIAPPAEGKDQHPERMMAFAWLAMLWARRTDPGARIETYSGMTVRELFSALGMGQDGTIKEADDDGPERDDLAEEIEANPTDSAPGLRSLARGDSTPERSAS